MLVCLLGFVMIIKPDAFWLLTESWKNNADAEPSHFYLWSTRLGGFIIIMVCIGAFVVK
ncbi:DUF6199 family natural product biosynthesis protein [Paenibacillus lacisoli]|uniref:DUF6199 family natural product biosynthesis protein n=1 Tax=Paenibacillus lacisoli TaxID=3064525 RepID=UPI00387E7684